MAWGLQSHLPCPGRPAVLQPGLGQRGAEPAVMDAGRNHPSSEDGDLQVLVQELCQLRARCELLQTLLGPCPNSTPVPAQVVEWPRLSKNAHRAWTGRGTVAGWQEDRAL